MRPHISDEPARAADATPAVTPRDLVLARIACTGGATRAEIVRDLAPLFAHRLSPAEWRTAAGSEIGELIRAKLATDKRGRLTATDAGIGEADRTLGFKGASHAEWPDLRDLRLVALALGAAGDGAAKQKALMRPEGLRALILTHGYRLPKKSNPTTGWLRAQLALVALERAFGNKLKSGLGSGDGLAPKAGRLLAGHLFRRPLDFGTDQKLLVALAAEQVDAVQTDLDALRAAVLRGLGSRALETRLPAKAAPQPSTSTPKLKLVGGAAAAIAAQPAPQSQPRPAPAPAAVARPDLQQFARAVNAAASGCAEGWAGNRKAYISNVWAAIRAARAEWAVTEIEFKCMLAEAHRAGEVVLANADLIDKRFLKELEASALPYKNTVWHFVRVED